MKKLFVLFAALCQVAAFSQGSCGINVDFEYEIIGNEVHFTNLSESTLSQVNIAGYYWQFGSASTSADENPILPLENLDPCDATACLTVYADSSGFGTEYCFVEPHCIVLDVGSDPLSTYINYTIDEASYSFVLDYGAQGGVAPYVYSLELDGMPIYVMPMDSIFFLNGQDLTLSICVTDASGCSTCATETIAFPYTCEFELNANLVNSFLTAEPVVIIGGQIVYDFDGTLSIDGDSTYFVSSFQPYQGYLTTVGTHEICCSLVDWFLESYPSCPESVCIEIEVEQLSVDCNAAYTFNQNNGEISFFNTSSGFYDAVLWDFGNGEISTMDNPFVYLLPGTYVVTLEVSNSATGCSSSQQQTVTVIEQAHICMQVYIDSNQNGQQDLGEMPADSLYVMWGNEWWLVSNGSLDVWTNPGSGCLSFGGSSSNIQVTEMPNWSGCFMDNSYLLELAPGEELCPLVIGIYIPQTTICGTYYFDANTNGVMDDNETGVAFAEIQVQWLSQNVQIVCDENGAYCIDLPIYNSVTFTPLLDGESSALIQPQYQYVYTFPEPLTVDFGAYYIDNAIDVGVSMSPAGAVTPGFSTAYYATVQNFSNLPTTCMLFVYHAAGQTTTFVSDGGAQSSGSASWNVDVPAYGTTSFWYTVENSTAMVLGEAAVINASLVTVETDVNMANNSSELQMTVVGSYDPNNKLVNPAGMGSLGIIGTSVESFEYTINFQNTGSAPAVNIRVFDELPVLLDPSSIQLLHTSHPATMLVQGQQVTWNFYNIMLADSMTNEAESHGHITFRIAPLNPLEDGQVISNEAAIYFDFNEPIITAPALSTVDETIGVADLEEKEMFSVYPNPVVDGIIYVSGVSGELQVFDTAGRVVISKQVTSTQNQLDVSKLNSGIYLIKSNKTGSSSSFVKH